MESDLVVLAFPNSWKKHVISGRLSGAIRAFADGDYGNLKAGDEFLGEFDGPMLLLRALSVNTKPARDVQDEEAQKAGYAGKDDFLQRAEAHYKLFDPYHLMLVVSFEFVKEET